MTQTPAPGPGGPNVSNLMTASSTPIRIGSGLSSLHGSSAVSVAHNATGNESSSPGAGGSGSAGAVTNVPQSSSVPTGAAENLRHQLQSQNSLSMGTSNQSLGVSAGAMGSSSITPPNSAGLRQTGGAGIRCFCIDLFIGTYIENQEIIANFYECEINYLKQLGFPVTTTFFAQLSPRQQYTGVIEEPELLEKDDEITLTTDRSWSWRSTKSHIYVNAEFLFDDVKEFDYILIGCSIQVWVKKKKQSRLRCVVEVGGVLNSRMPVRFPGRCNKFGMSQEEIEDITFCKEVGISIIASYVAGTKSYLDNLKEALNLLECGKMYIYARVVLNDVKGCEHELDWAADEYDGFLIELNDEKADPSGSILHLCPAAITFIERVHHWKKPIIFNPSGIAYKRLLLEKEHEKYVFHYPDKYLYDVDSIKDTFYFCSLYEAIEPPITKSILAKLPYCDRSLTGIDSLARSCVIASYESNASAIFVIGFIGVTARTISFFRPKVPIIFITRLTSAAKFASMCHNITMLRYCGKTDDPHQVSVFKHCIMGLLYARDQNIVKHNDTVIFAYSELPGVKFHDKYVAYKYHENHFPQHLERLLFREPIKLDPVLKAAVDDFE